MNNLVEVYNFTCSFITLASNYSCSTRQRMKKKQEPELKNREEITEVEVLVGPITYFEFKFSFCREGFERN